MQTPNNNDSHKLDQQAKKSDNPADFQSNGEILSTKFAPNIQISNAGKTILDLKEGDMVSFYTDNTADKHIISMNIIG